MIRPLLVYPSSWIGYIRIGLAVGAVVRGNAVESAALLTISRLLDPVDGMVARRRGETSRFGSALDLIADLLTHTVVWWLSGLAIGPYLIALEWAAGVGILWTLLRDDPAWKTALTQDSPRWIRAYFRNDMRNVYCLLGVLGHFVVPMSAYLGLESIWIWAAVPGLILYEAVTAYLIVSVLRTFLSSR